MNIDIFYNENGILNRNKLKENWVKDNLPDLYLKVIEMDLPNINLFSQKLWHYLNNHFNYLNCDWCGEENKRWQSFTTGYKNGCSRSCAIQLSRPKSIITDVLVMKNIL